MSKDRWLGLFFIGFALLLILVWVPLDTASGYIEKQRRQVLLGDALAPTVAGVIILLAAIMLFFEKSRFQIGLSRANFIYVAALLALVTMSFALMRFAGPLFAELLTTDGYRPLRATAPWKHIGYVTGGAFLIFALITMVERRVRWRSLIIALIAIGLITAFYDLPFDNLLLPPNGDV